jgi:hypothetical protein
VNNDLRGIQERLRRPGRRPSYVLPTTDSAPLLTHAVRLLGTAAWSRPPCAARDGGERGDKGARRTPRPGTAGGRRRHKRQPAQPAGRGPRHKDHPRTGGPAHQAPGPASPPTGPRAATGTQLGREASGLGTQAPTFAHVAAWGVGGRNRGPGEESGRTRAHGAWRRWRVAGRYQVGRFRGSGDRRWVRWWAVRAREAAERPVAIR